MIPPRKLEISAELRALRRKVVAMNNKLAELTEEELALVTEGRMKLDMEIKVCPCCGTKFVAKRRNMDQFSNR